MKRFFRLLSLMMALLLLCTYASAVSVAENASVSYGQEDLTRLTYDDLLKLQSDIRLELQTNHTLSSDQKSGVLAAVKKAAEDYYTREGFMISGWAWYDNEYTYTKDWDFYTLKTHLDYKDNDNRNHKAIIYAEVYRNDQEYEVVYLKTDGTDIFDKRQKTVSTLWFETPETHINNETGIDLSVCDVSQLNTLLKKTVDEIKSSHSVPANVAGIILSLTKYDLEQYCEEKNIKITSYAWYDNEYSYTRDWDFYWLQTHVNYKTDSKSSQLKDSLYSEVCYVDGIYELVFLKMGDNVIKDRKSELVISSVNGVPEYSWGIGGSVNKADSDNNNAAESVSEEKIKIVYVTPEPTLAMTPEIVYITPEPMPELTPVIVYVTPEPADSVFSVDLAELSDEELIDALQAIRAEQRARIKHALFWIVRNWTFLRARTRQLQLM